MALTANASTNGVSATKTTQQQVTSLRHGIQWHRSMTWHYQDRAGVPRTRTVHAERRTRSVPFLGWINRLWIRRMNHAKHLARKPLIAHLALWQCIHRGEGAWNSNTGNGFYGGLQMTSPWGAGVYYVSRADLLSPTEQMRKAELGYIASGHSRAWLEGQWPNTSPPCMAYS